VQLRKNASQTALEDIGQLAATPPADVAKETPMPGSGFVDTQPDVGASEDGEAPNEACDDRLLDVVRVRRSKGLQARQPDCVGTPAAGGARESDVKSVKGRVDRSAGSKPLNFGSAGVGRRST